jgi:hypothetical protein
MKRIITLILMFPVILAVAQKKSEKDTKSASTPLTYVRADAKVKKYHTKEELEGMGKLDLTQLYMERVMVITELMPYIALHTKPGATLREMGIPETKPNLEHLEKEVKNKETYITAVDATLDDIIPYADTKNIIWSILFFEQIIRTADAGETVTPNSVVETK